MRAPRYSLVPTLLLIGSLGFGQGGGIPSLEHNAPFLGHELVLNMEGATPGAPAALMQSPAAGHVVLPYGVLELDPDQVTVIAVAEVNSEGRARFFVPLPEDAASAELQRHYQILVGDAARPTSAALSEALHLRVLGPRVYVGHGPFGLSIVSASDESVVARVEIDTPVSASISKSPGGAVFSRNFSRGAVMTTSDELLIFDPFFGAVLSRVPFENAVRELIMDSSQEHVLILERRSAGGPPTLNGRVHIIELATGGVEAVIDLPHAVLTKWAAHRDGYAYIAEYRSDFTTFVRRFGIERRVVLDAFEVGQGFEGEIGDMAIFRDLLFITINTNPGGEFHRIELSPSPTSVANASFPGWVDMRDLLPVPAARRILFGRHFLSYPVFVLHSAPMSGSGPVENIEPPPGARRLASAVARGRTVWGVSTELDGDGESDLLMRMADVLSPTWTNLVASPCAGAFGQIGSIRDRYVDRIVYGARSCMHPDPTSVLVFHDPITNAETQTALDYRQSSLRTVPVPSRVPPGLDLPDGAGPPPVVQAGARRQ